MHYLFALLAQETSKSPGNQGLFEASPILLMAAIAFAGYFILIRPMKNREKKEREELFANLKKNDEVLTASGIIGIIAIIKDNEVVLKVDESSNVRLRVLKSSIVRVLNPKEAVKDAAKSGPDAGALESVKAGSPPAGKSG
jgi:preprotein translocase subunit YajC